MQSPVRRFALGIALAGVLPTWAVLAVEEAKPLPTLSIKGEVVSLDTTDPAATLLKVKDRYGFETPIYLTQETKMRQGDATLNVASLSTGAAIEVEYNFDINTAKRHAVSVRLSVPVPAEPAPPAAAVPAPAAPAAPQDAPAAASAPSGTETTPAAAAPSQPEAAPATP